MEISEIFFSYLKVINALENQRVVRIKMYTLALGVA